MKFPLKFKDFLVVSDKVKLRKGLETIQSISTLGLVLGSIVFYLLTDYFSYSEQFRIYSSLLYFATFYQVILFVIINVFKKEKFWNYAGYGWSVLYIYLIYLTGGIDSSFIFMIFFIPVISVAQLDEKLTRNTGIFTAVLFSLLIFTDSRYLSVEYIGKHIIQVLFVSVIIFYIYSFVKEILRQRYEKEQFKRKFIELSELDQVKQMFLTAMSHQLRTPLSGARWALNTVMKDKTLKSRDILEEGYNKIVTSIDIIGEMLKTAEFDIGAQKINLKKEKIDIVSLINHIIDNLKYMTASNGSSIVTDFEEEEIFINADRKMLDLALTNVLDNAVRYSPKGKITVKVNKLDDYLKIKVSDTGIGIDSSDLEYIFQKFYRGKNAIAIDPNESGVGLYATKKIVEMHRGAVGLSSLIGKGTEITVDLPFA